jgi:hypothetical protein
MQWDTAHTGALTVRVSGAGSGGAAAPVAGASVHAELAAPLAKVGTLRVGGAGGLALTATGTARADAVSDAHGVAALGLLPAGTYNVVVAPPAGAASAAITLANVVLSEGALTAPVTLAAPVTFAGVLMPPASMVGATVGAKVTAIDRGVLAAATPPSATVAADGTYTLTLAAGRTYELLVEPDPRLGLARTVVGVVTPHAGDAPRSDTLPPSLTWNGSVFAGDRAIAGALVQVFCAVPAASCFDPALPLASGTTGADGTLTLVLPGPPPAP